MKKTIRIIVFFAVLLVSISAYTGKVVDAKEGYKIPSLTLIGNNTQINLNELKGKYVLLSFWASTDAISRVACNEYSAFAKNAEAEERFCFLSVNFDRSEMLFNEIVKRDRLQAETQYFAQGDKASRLMADYQLENGFSTYLIDPQGRIVAKNPSTQHLNEIFK